MLIKELIRLNTNAKFFNDVQLRWFWDAQKNAELAKGYIFTQQAGENQKSTVDALNMVRFGLTDPGSENRMLFLATFGQGKTHLALAMANIFGKPPDSEEVKWLIESLTHAYGESPAIKNFTDLKERNPRHLVVCLQGDVGGFDLGSYFVRELERSLATELCASGGMLPLWYKTALDTLEASVAPQKTKADAFLEPHEMDLPKLKQRLGQKDASLYDLVRDLIEHVTGVRPDLGSRLSLHDLVDFICLEYCGQGKPYAGLVILFDEFNAFMHAYGKQSPAGAPLQDLLNGIEDNKGKSIFVGFAQRDPQTIVDALPPAKRADLHLEMSRIPPGQRTHLFNNLETILDSYIGANETTLRAELQTAGAWPALEEAEEATQMLFRRRYDRELHWNQEQFRSKVTIGCFPLHPLTTALLCSVELADTGATTPRGILQFVLESQKTIGDLPVATNGVPTWISATRMVDWFEKTLCVQEVQWEQYLKALSDGGGDLPDIQKEVLKAMLLHVIATLPMANVSYDRTIALLAGITQDEAKTALQAMADRNLIERDTANKKYIFLSASGGDRELRDYITREIEQTQLKLKTLQDADVVSASGFKATAVSVDWGSSLDWQAMPTLLTSEFFTEETLKTLLLNELAPVVWLIPRDEDEKSALEAKVQGIVDAACGTVPQPLTVFLPNAPFPGVHEGLKKLQVLADLPAQKRMDFSAFLPGTKIRANGQLKEQMQALQASQQKWFVHTSLTPALQAENLTGDPLVKRVVMDCFKKAPPSFVTTQREDAPKLRSASALLGKLLLNNQAAHLQEQIQLRPKDGNLKMAENVLDTILTVGRSAAWGIVSNSKHLQEPTNTKVKLAWDELSNMFPTTGSAGELKGVIEKLQKAPYGYDSNVLTLLLCAWIGFHRHDIEITKGGAVYSVTQLQELLNADRPAGFVTELSANSYRIKRRDRSVALQEIQNIFSRVQQISTNPFARQEASDAIVKLGEYLADGGNSDPVMRTRVEETKDRVKGDLDLADAYDAKAQDVLTKLAAVKKVNDSLGLLNKARNLPSCNGVKPNQPPVAEIVATAEAALEKTVEDTCQRLSKLLSITDFGRQDDDLKSCHSDLDGKAHLQHKVTDALAALLQAKSELEAKQSEDATLATIEALSAQVPMSALEKTLETLDTITGGSEKVAARLAAKRKEIADQITALTTFAEGLDSRIESVKDANELRAVEREIDGKAASFAGHGANEAKLNAATARCSRLAEFFSTITPLSQRGLNSPQDLVTVLDDCAAVRQQFSSGLSQAQAELIDQIEASKRNDAEAKGRAAKEWLQGMEKAWAEDGSDPAAFLPKLGGSPAFLPDDAKVALSALRTTVREKLEANDEEWIVSKFQGISDKSRRQNLVERLQGLLSAD